MKLTRWIAYRILEFAQRESQAIPNTILEKLRFKAKSKLCDPMGV
jgi:hypothetical protein